MNFRKATLAHISLLQYWDTKAHVRDALGLEEDENTDREREEELSHELPGMRKYIAYDSDEPIGFLQIIDLRLEVSQYWGEFTENIRAIDIWIGEEKNLGKGYGTQMMQRAILECFKDPGVTEIWIDPLATNTKVHNFYEKLGFIFDHEQWFDEDHCYVYKLTRHQF